MGVQKEYSREGKLNEKKSHARLHVQLTLKKFHATAKKIHTRNCLFLFIHFFQMGFLQYNQIRNSSALNYAVNQLKTEGRELQ